MKRVLITGAYGFLGRYTAKKFKSENWHVSGIGHGKWHESEYSKWGLDRWYETTITFEALINLNQKFDLIVHCGGSGSVGFSYANPYEDFQKSVQSTLSLLEYIRLQCKDCQFIYPSSPAVLGSLGDRPIFEDEISDPVSPYGFHKKTAEELCLSYYKNFGINTSIIRFFSIYGAGLQKQLLWDACVKITSATGTAKFFGTGDETRDWVHVEDAADLTYLLAVDETVTDTVKIINCGSGEKVTVKDTLQLLVNLYGKAVELEFNQHVKEGDPRFYHADISRAKQLGWVPKVDFVSGMEDYIQFFKTMYNG